MNAPNSIKRKGAEARRKAASVFIGCTTLVPVSYRTMPLEKFSGLRIAEISLSAQKPF
jgi:hypothetical protein